MISQSNINTALIAFLSIAVTAGFTFAMASYWNNRQTKATAAENLAKAAATAALNLAAASAATVSRITELERQLSLVTQAVVPISTAFQAILIKELTHYHTPRMDELMTRVGPPSTLSIAEEAELAHLLSQRTKDMGDEITESERDAAMILPIVMKRARAEAVLIDGASPSIIRLVSISHVPDEQKT